MPPPRACVAQMCRPARVSPGFLHLFPRAEPLLYIYTHLCVKEERGGGDQALGEEQGIVALLNVRLMIVEEPLQRSPCREAVEVERVMMAEEAW